MQSASSQSVATFSGGFTFEEDDQPVIPLRRPDPPPAAKVVPPIIPAATTVVDLTAEEDDAPQPKRQRVCRPSPPKIRPEPEVPVTHSLDALAKSKPTSLALPTASGRYTAAPKAGGASVILPGPAREQSASAAAGQSAASLGRAINLTHSGAGPSSRPALGVAVFSFSPAPAPAPAPRPSPLPLPTASSSSNGRTGGFASFSDFSQAPASSSQPSTPQLQQLQTLQQAYTQTHPPRTDPVKEATQRAAYAAQLHHHQHQAGTAHPQQQPHLGRIPVISSASAARLPSDFLVPPPVASSSRGRPSNDYYRMQSAHVSASMSAAGVQAPGAAPRAGGSCASASSGFSAYVPSNGSGNGNGHGHGHGHGHAHGHGHTHASTNGNGNGNGKGKAREIVDLTGPSDSDDDMIIDDTPICIGQLTSLALILYPVQDLQPLAPPIPIDKHGVSIKLPDNAPPLPSPPQPPLPIHIYRGQMQGANETLRLSTPVTHETFGVMEHRVANIVASLFGDGYCGTGVTRDGKGKLWCEASVVRRGERNVRPRRFLHSREEDQRS